MKLNLLNPNYPEQPFPDIASALVEPNGLLAVGGCLSPARLINAYYHGIFPWFSADQPILWWSPDPRCILFPQNLTISTRLARRLRQPHWQFTWDQAFEAVVQACSEPRDYTADTWITSEMKQAYHRLHQLKLAHSAEIWCDGELIAGLYGIGLGQIFFGESMFHRQTDASKVVLVKLMQQLSLWNYQLMDCQIPSAHLHSLGAINLSRHKFNHLLMQYRDLSLTTEAWL
ncbi:MAG: hypothetical protein RL637_2 [Pseudomonadota bacterium]